MKSGIRSVIPQGGATVVVVAGCVGVVVVDSGGGAGLVVPVVTGVVEVVVGGDVSAGATVATVAGCFVSFAPGGGAFLRRPLPTVGAATVVEGGVLAGGLVVVVGARAVVGVGWRSCEELDAWRPPVEEQADRQAESATRAATHRSVHRRREPVHPPTPSDRTPERSTDGRRLPKSQRVQSIRPRGRWLGC
jgi:hypothetical protein